MILQTSVHKLSQKQKFFKENSKPLFGKKSLHEHVQTFHNIIFYSMDPYMSRKRKMLNGPKIGWPFNHTRIASFITCEKNLTNKTGLLFNQDTILAV